MTFGAQLGFVAESTYGTPVTVTRFYEFISESFKQNMGWIEDDDGHRAGERVARSDRNEPHKMGVTGTVTGFVPTKGFGLQFKHAFGGAAIASVVDSNYVQTFTIGDLLGLMLTGQVNREFNDGTDQAHTYHGLKIVSFELACSVESALTFTIEYDGEDSETTTALATAVYATDYRKFSWAGGSVTVGGSAVELTGFKFRLGNPQNTSRYRLAGSTLKKQPLENAKRLVEWELTAVDHTALTQYNRVVSETRASRFAAIVATFNGPIAHGGTTLPQVTITIPEARFDDIADHQVDDFEPLAPTFTGVARFNGTDNATTATYRTTDAAA